MDQRLSELLGSALDAWTIEYRVHATRQMFKRRIEEKDVMQLLTMGTIIEREQLSRIIRMTFPFRVYW